MEKRHLGSIKGGKSIDEETDNEKLKELQKSTTGTIDKKQIKELGTAVHRAQIESFRKLAAEHSGVVISVEEATVLAEQAGQIATKDINAKKDLLKQFPHLDKLIEWLWIQKSPVDDL